MTLEQTLRKMSDLEKWKYVIDNKDQFKIMLDNDYTSIVLKNPIHEDEFEFSVPFYDDIGDASGIIALLACIGIESEHY